MLVPLAEIAGECRAAGQGLGAFNVIHIESAEAILSGAHQAGRPVVLQISQNAIRYHNADLEPIAVATLCMARNSSLPVSVHLDHATDLDLIARAIELGFSSIMYDGSQLEFDDNCATTAQVARWCHEAGISIEAELGEVGGKDGAHAPGVRTDPQAAREFVSATGVDLLAVAVGSSHAMTSRDAQLDLDLIAALADTVPVPLVLHGSSGVSDSLMVAAIRAGMTKINVSTHLNKVFTRQVRAFLDEHPDLVDTRKWMAPARGAMADEVARLLRQYAVRSDATGG